MIVSQTKDLLSSGLRLVTVEAPHLHSAMVSVYVRTGSRHESSENNGVSHFLEHLFFRGSETYPDTVRMNAAVEEVGGNLNGVTTRDHGFYYTPLHPKHLDVGIRILGDMLTRPLLTGMEVEREIILEEMLDEVDEKGRDIEIDNLTKRELFGDHPLALKIAGTRESVKTLQLSQLRTHLEQHYVTGNMVVAVAGPVKRSEVLPMVEEAFAKLPRGKTNGDAPTARMPTGPWMRYVRHDEAQTEFRLTFPAVPEHHEDFPAMLLLRRILDDGLSSRLPYEVVEKRGLAYTVHAGLEAFEDVGLFEVEGATAPHKAGALVEQICLTLASLCDKPPEEEELERAKRRHRMFLEFASDSPAELAGWYGGTELFGRPESFEDRCRRVEVETPARIRQVARRYLRADRMGVVAVGQRKGQKALEKAVRDAPGLPRGRTR